MPASLSIREPLLRDGTRLLERRALESVRASLPSLPARVLVHWILWPETVLEFAAWADVAPAQAYNTLSRANGRAYHATRRAFSLRLGLVEEDLDHVLDRPRRPVGAPTSLPWTAPAAEPSAGHPPETERVGPIPRSLPPRDGSGAVERLALQHVEANRTAFPAGMVLQMVLWPHTLADLAREIPCAPQQLSNVLAAAQRPDFPTRRKADEAQPIRDGASRILGVETVELDHLLEAVPASPIPLPAVDPPGQRSTRRRRGRRPPSYPG